MDKIKFECVLPSNIPTTAKGWVFTDLAVLTTLCGILCKPRLIKWVKQNEFVTVSIKEVVTGLTFALMTVPANGSTVTTKTINGKVCTKPATLFSTLQRAPPRKNR